MASVRNHDTKEEKESDGSKRPEPLWKPEPLGVQIKAPTPETPNPMCTKALHPCSTIVCFAKHALCHAKFVNALNP